MSSLMVSVASTNVVGGWLLPFRSAVDIKIKKHTVHYYLRIVYVRACRVSCVAYPEIRVIYSGVGADLTAR